MKIRTSQHRLLVLFVALSLQWVPELSAKETKPNVLFISMDDLNDWIGCLGGHPQTITPNLDRLAASGTLFTNAHCPAPACNPSRSAIFSGRSPHKTGIYSNRQNMRDVIPDATLIPKHFSNQGYHAIGSGKMLHYIIDAQSWDDYFPKKESEWALPETLYPDPRPLSLPVGGPWQYIETDWGPLDATDEEFGGDYSVTEYVNDYLSKDHEKPFFLACGIYRPHEPWFVPAKYFEKFPLESIQLPPGYKKDDLDDLSQAGQKMGRNRYFAHIQSEGQWKQGVQSYLASIHFADAMLGRVLDALESSPHASNTIVVLWSDHGWHLGEKEHWQKFTAWRACTRIPLMVKVPAGISEALPSGTIAGTKSDQPVNLLGLYPTLTQLCGLPAMPGCDGMSIVPQLKDPSKSTDPTVTFLHDAGIVGVSGKDWRYIHYKDGSEELYHIAKDPYEWNNLIKNEEGAEALAHLKKFVPTKFAPKPQVKVKDLPSLKWQVVKEQSEIPSSQEDGSLVRLVFVNKREEAIRFHLVDTENQMTHRGEVAATSEGETKGQQGSVWAITDTDEQILGYFQVGDRMAKGVIE